MYPSLMSTYSVKSFRQQLSAVIDEAQKIPVFIRHNDENVAVVISANYYEKLLTALEDVEDLASIKESLTDPKSSIPWVQMKR